MSCKVFDKNLCQKFYVPIPFFHSDSPSQDPWIYYYGSPYGDEPKSGSNPSYNIWAGKLYFLQCQFRDLNNRAIDIATKVLKLLHSQCIFFNCSAPYDGIINVAEDISVIQHKFCAISCKKSSLTYINLKNYYTDNSNDIIESSITSCFLPTSDRTVYLNYGNINIASTNFSKNVASSYSAYFIYPYRSKSSTTTNYSTFEGNKCEDGYVTIFQDGDNYQRFEYSNVLNNFQKSKDRGTVYVFYDYLCPYIYKCCFFKDRGNGKLISSVPGLNILIVKCHIDKLTTDDSRTYEVKDIESNFYVSSVSYLNTFQCYKNMYVILSRNYVESYNHADVLNKIIPMFKIICELE